MERLTNANDAQQWALHRYRYEVAAQFTRDSDVVLDAACGIGYGRDILAGEWIGADKDPPARPDALTVDLCTWEPEFDYDVFVGLETIEHLADYGAYVAAAKRARRTIVISTPIIPTVHFNPYHLHDFTTESLESLFSDWEVIHYEAQVDPVLGYETYGIWAFSRNRSRMQASRVRPMKIVVPYTNLRPETQLALEATGRRFVRAKVGDDDRYWQLLRSLWAAGKDFAVVEHDIIVSPDTFDIFDGCPSEWCVAPYPFRHRLCSGLGCTRFRGSLLLRFPEVMLEVEKRSHPAYLGQRNWRSLDACIRDLLWERDVVRCRHDPVGHVGEHGCECGNHPLEPEGIIDDSWVIVPGPDMSGRYRGKT
jgi:hypothetical protein